LHCRSMQHCIVSPSHSKRMKVPFGPVPDAIPVSPCVAGGLNPQACPGRPTAPPAAALALVGERLTDGSAVAWVGAKAMFLPTAKPLPPGSRRREATTFFPTLLRARGRPAEGARPFHAFGGRAANGMGCEAKMQGPLRARSRCERKHWTLLRDATDFQPATLRKRAADVVTSRLLAGVCKEFRSAHRPEPLRGMHHRLADAAERQNIDLR
jgi:hypothetical protein